MSLNKIKINSNQVANVDDKPSKNSNELVKSGGIYNAIRGYYPINNFRLFDNNGTDLAYSHYIKTNGETVNIFCKQDSETYKIIVYEYSLYGVCTGYYSPAIFVPDHIKYQGNAPFIRVLVGKNTGGGYTDITPSDYDLFSIICDHQEYNPKCDEEFTEIADSSSFVVLHEAEHLDYAALRDRHYVVINNGKLKAKIWRNENFDAPTNTGTLYRILCYGLDENFENETQIGEISFDVNLSNLTYKYITFRIYKTESAGVNMTESDISKFSILVDKNQADYAYIPIKQSKLAGKTINALGCSLTEQGYVTGALVNNTNCLINNYGVSGTTMSKVRLDNNFLSRYGDMTNDCDIVLVEASINDWNLNVDFGVFEHTQGDELYPAMHQLFGGLKDKYTNVDKDVKIFIWFPPHEYFSLSGYPDYFEYTMDTNGVLTRTLHNGKSLLDFINAVKEVAQFYSIPVIDVYGSSLIQPFQSSNKTAFTIDGLHFNTDGGELVAKLIENTICQYI